MDQIKVQKATLFLGLDMSRQLLTPWFVALGKNFTTSTFFIFLNHYMQQLCQSFLLLAAQKSDLALLHLLHVLFVMAHAMV